MQSRIETIPIEGKKPIVAIKKLKQLNGKYIVWWYGPTMKNEIVDTAPRFIVFFRALDSNNTLGKIECFSVSVTYLGHLEIGTIWQNAVCIEKAVLIKKRFNVDFSNEGWQFNSPHEEWSRSQKYLINKEDYLLSWQRDKNWLIEFEIHNNKKLYIPSIEFFIRCYAQDKNLSRILINYGWPEVEPRLFVPINKGDYPSDIWPVKLTKLMRNCDTVFLAHIYHDSYTSHTVKLINAQIESEYRGGLSKCFLKAAPWFQGPAEILVQGLWINDHQSFLGLNVLGCSEPAGLTISRNRPKPTNDDIPPPRPDKASDDGVRKFHTPPPIINLVDDEPPDIGSPSVEVETQTFIKLGRPREIIDISKKDGEYKKGVFVKSKNKKFSPGEPSGTDKGTGNERTHSPTEDEDDELPKLSTPMESQGMLRDMWNAMLAIKASYPDQISSVEWYTFEDSFCSEPAPKLIFLEKHNKDTDISATTRRWVYKHPKLKELRSILVSRIIIDKKAIYIFEIERKITKTKKPDEKTGEESFQGLVFNLNDEDDFTEQTHKILSEIRYEEGVFHNLILSIPGHADTFSHSIKIETTRPCERALLNAFNRMGITLEKR